MQTDTSLAGSIAGAGIPAAEPRAPGARSRREIARDAGIIWPPAVAVAALGALICIVAAPGLNWGLWTAAASLGLWVVVRRARGGIGWPVAVVLVAACTLALGAGVTADVDFYPVILLGTATMLAVAMLLAEGAPVGGVGARFIATAPFVGGLRTVGEALNRLLEGVTLVRSGRDAGALRGVFIALPVVALLTLLLSAADPVLARLRDDALQLMGDSSVVIRIGFFVVLGALTLGAYGIAARPAAALEQGVGAPTRDQKLALTDRERLIVLGSVSALFALFVVLQLSYFFGNAPAIAGSGVTYANYARQGFGELTLAASITTVLVLWLDAHATRGAREGRVRLAAVTLLFLVQLVLDSAFRRVVLYEAAYGYTAARLYAKVYMVIVTLALIALGVEIWGTVDTRRLARRVALLGIAALVTLTYWNHQAWIAQRNLARFAATGQLDETYLVNKLSPNAVPTIVRALPALPAAESARVRDLLAKQYTASRVLRAAHWYERGVRTRQAHRALASIGIP